MTREVMAQGRIEADTPPRRRLRGRAASSPAGAAVVGVAVALVAAVLALGVVQGRPDGPLTASADRRGPATPAPRASVEQSMGVPHARFRALGADVSPPLPAEQPPDDRPLTVRAAPGPRTLPTAKSLPDLDGLAPGEWETVGRMDTATVLLGNHRQIAVRRDSDDAVVVVGRGRVAAVVPGALYLFGQECPGPRCGLVAVRVTGGDDLQPVAVAAPLGWAFSGPPAAYQGGVVGFVHRVEGPGQALAVVGSAASTAVLVPGSAGAQPAAGLAVSRNRIAFAVAGHAVVWRPSEPDARARATVAIVGPREHVVIVRKRPRTTTSG